MSIKVQVYPPDPLTFSSAVVPEARVHPAGERKAGGCGGGGGQAAGAEEGTHPEGGAAERPVDSSQAPPG